MKIYQDRTEAGKILAQALCEFADQKDVLILALPRGGVPVAFEIAQILHAPLDVFIVRKLGVPGHEEYAMGAIAMGNVTVFNESIIRDLNISQEAIRHAIVEEENELKRRELTYRGNYTLPVMTGKTIILVDDGIATGATMKAAIKALRKGYPNQIVVAVPVVDSELVEEMEKLVEKFICPNIVAHLNAVGSWYENFPQTSDDEVHDFLTKARQSSNLC